MFALAYPDWVLKHKKKGTYINKVGNNFYLYAAHSEHIPGTANKARRVCDGYLGKITEKDGFVPKKEKPSPLALEYGFSCAITSLCNTIFQRIIEDYPDSYQQIIIRSILLSIYGVQGKHLHHLSYLSTFIKDDFIIDKQTDFLIQRSVRMIQSTLSQHFPDVEALENFKTVMCHIQIVKWNRDWVLTQLDPLAQEWIQSIPMDFKENVIWKKLLK